MTYTAFTSMNMRGMKTSRIITPVVNGGFCDARCMFAYAQNAASASSATDTYYDMCTMCGA